MSRFYLYETIKREPLLLSEKTKLDGQKHYEIKIDKETLLVLFRGTAYTHLSLRGIEEKMVLGHT